MKKKIRVAILCGGKSAEHEVSLLSAKNVIHALDKDKYEVIVIGIDKRGRWSLHDAKHILAHENAPTAMIHHSGKQLSYALDDSRSLVNFSEKDTQLPIDVVFPVLHGPYGEDGTIQGLLKIVSVPFVGPGVLGSAIGMDKDVMKRLLKGAGIPVANFLVFKAHERSVISFETIQKQLGLPFFVKPANLGSSVGISKVHNEKEFEQAIDEAFLYDTKVLLEEAIIGREIECGILGNDPYDASLPGEIVPHDEFYSYEAKYLDPNGAELRVPANLDEKSREEVQRLAKEVAKVLCVEGMARVDFFLEKDGKVVVNEINTIPGFTAISMYPKMWEANGVSYSQLLDRLIELAIERYKKEKQLKTSR